MRLRTAFAAMIGGLLLGTTAIIGAAKAGVSCYAEASAGKNITATRVSDELDGPVTLAADGLTGGLGFGCDAALSEMAGFGSPVIGFLARYDWSDLKSAMGPDGKMSSDGMWSVAARAGIKINPSVLVYGLAGIAGTELSYPGLETDPTGILLGAGMELDLAVKNLSLFAEYNHVAWDKLKSEDNSALVRPDTDVFRVGLRLKFNVIP